MKEALKEFVVQCTGNWKEFNCFVWHREDEIENPENWYIWYTHSRDSDLLEMSNAKQIKKILQPFLDKEEDIFEESHGHWAVGYIDGFSVKVRDTNNQITDVFKKVYELHKRIDTYPVLDEEHLSELEHDALYENLKEIINRFDICEKINQEELQESVYRYLDTYFPHELYNCDGNGAYPSEELIKEYLEEINVLV